MQFKGTPKFPIGVLDRTISRVGAYWNAFTWLDWTAYFETLPADQMELALELESDRMLNTTFEPKEVESERTVIISERQGHENDPSFRLAEEVQAAAFRVHSYHHEVIGDMADLESISRGQLYQHYKEHYIPSNAVLAIAGDFRVRPTLDRIRKAFGSIPSISTPVVRIRAEPEQRGERRISVVGPGETTYLEVVYHAPPGFHEDFLPLSVVNSVLAGASSLNLFGGGISNRTSRLYRKLVESGVATSVDGNLAATIDPYLYSIRMTISPGRSYEEALKILDQELSEVQNQPIRREELAKAIQQARALFAYGSESITNQAFWMGYSEMFANYNWFQTYLDQLAEVEEEQALITAQKYLTPENRVVGVYIPNGGTDGKGS
jgi:zinc protease